MSKLFTRESENTKLRKTTGTKYYSIALFLSPSKNNSRGIDLCPHASAACRATCLNTSGLASVFPRILEAQKRKAEEFLADRKAFIERLKKEILSNEKKAIKNGLRLAVRLNGTSDIPWSIYNFYTQFPNVQFYDYTKNIYEVRKQAKNKIKNFHLTYSYSGENINECKAALALGTNVAVVFSEENFPSEFLGYPVKSGENSDLRFLDGQTYVIGLKAKGKAKKDTSNFVIQIDRKK